MVRLACKHLKEKKVSLMCMGDGSLREFGLIPYHHLTSWLKEMAMPLIFRHHIIHLNVFIQFLFLCIFEGCSLAKVFHFKLPKTVSPLEVSPLLDLYC